MSTAALQRRPVERTTRQENQQPKAGLKKPDSRHLRRQELIRRWDSERELFNDDIARVRQNTKTENLLH